MKPLHIILLLGLFFQGCTTRKIHGTINDTDYCVELLKLYASISKVHLDKGNMYFCVGIDISNNDTIFSIRGGNKEEYWSKIDTNGIYYKISPDILYKRIKSNIITFYPANQEISLWVQQLFGCYPIESNKIIQNEELDYVNYDPIEITLRFNEKTKSFDFLHHGLHKYNQSLKVKKEEWLEDLND